MLTEGCCSDPIPHHLTDVSEGGFAFRHQQPIETGKAIAICLPHDSTQHPIHGFTVWCHGKGDFYLIGVKFADEDSAFRARMVKQICHIEQYRRKIALNEGRHLSSEQAAQEWITLYAADFPQFESN